MPMSRVQIELGMFTGEILEDFNYFSAYIPKVVQLMRMRNERHHYFTDFFGIAALVECPRFPLSLELVANVKKCKRNLLGTVHSPQSSSIDSNKLKNL